MLLVQHATQKRKFLSSPAILKWFGCILKLLTISCVQHLLAKQLLLQYQQRKQKGCSNELDSLPYNDNSQKPNTYSTVFPTYTENKVVAKWSKFCKSGFLSPDSKMRQMNKFSKLATLMGTLIQNGVFSVMLRLCCFMHI